MQLNSLPDQPGSKNEPLEKSNPTVNSSTTIPEKNENIRQPDNLKESAGLDQQSAYVDPKGYFKIIPPLGWSPVEYPDDPRGKVDFNAMSGNERFQLALIAQKSPFANFDALFADNERGVHRWGSQRGASVESSKVSMFDVPVARFFSEIPGRLKLLQFHFVIGDVYYAIALGGAPKAYDKFQRLAMQSTETFQPMFPDIKSQDARMHVVTSKIRTAIFD